MKRGYKLTLGVIFLLSIIANFMAPSNIGENNIGEKEQVDTPKTASPSTYLIVTTNAIESNSDNLTDFIQYKESLGFTVEVITEDEYSGTGQARVLSIRNWLIANYQSKNIEYVLLIGDPDPDEYLVADTYGDVPMLMCYPRRGLGSDEESPTDYIYADLTGDWDTDSDGYHGEYGTISQDFQVDFEAEVYVGRIPVYSADYTSLDAILELNINHHNDTGAEKKKILLPMAISNYYNEDYSLISRTDGLDCPEYVWDYITNPMGMSDTVMYERSGLDPVSTGEFHYDMPLTKTNFINELNDDYGAVFWWAHGSEDGASRKYWATDDGDGVPEAPEMTWDRFIENTDMASLENDKPAFFYMSSCLNGKPEESDNLGYALLKRGAAISTVSASRVSWYKTGNWSPLQNYADNTAIGYVYMSYLLEDKMTNGKALFDAKDIFWNNWGAESWMNKMDFNLYGDPSMYYWWESVPSGGGGVPDTDDDDDDNDDDNGEDLDAIILFIIITALIGTGVLITAIVLITKKRGGAAAREIIPPYMPPEEPPIETTTPPSTTLHVCPKCGAVIAPGSKFCTKCGTEAPESPVDPSETLQPSITPNSCTKCGAILAPGSKFCTKCGNKILE